MIIMFTEELINYMICSPPTVRCPAMLTGCKAPQPIPHLYSFLCNATRCGLSISSAGCVPLGSLCHPSPSLAGQYKKLKCPQLALCSTTHQQLKCWHVINAIFLPETQHSITADTMKKTNPGPLETSTALHHCKHTESQPQATLLTLPEANCSDVTRMTATVLQEHSSSHIWKQVMLLLGSSTIRRCCAQWEFL